MEIRDKVHSLEESAEFRMILDGKMACKMASMLAAGALGLVMRGDWP